MFQDTLGCFSAQLYTSKELAPAGPNSSGSLATSNVSRVPVCFKHYQLLQMKATLVLWPQGGTHGADVTHPVNAISPSYHEGRQWFALYCFFIMLSWEVPT